MRVRTQLIAAVTLAVVASVSSAVAVWSIAQRAAAIDESQSRVRAVARDISALLALTQEYALYGGERPAQQWERRHARIVESLKPLMEVTSTIYPQLSPLSRDLEVLPELFANLKAASRDASNPLAARRKEMLVDLLVSSAQLVAEDAYRIQEGGAVMRTRATQQLVFAAVLVPVALAVAILLLSFLISRRVMMPLAGLQKIATAVRMGNLQKRNHSTTQDEFGDLAREFDAMTESLEFEKESLERANDILQELAAQREASEKRLRLIGDNIPALIAYIDPQERFGFGNRAYERTYGIPPEAIVGMPAREVLGPAVYAQSEPFIRRALSGERIHFERSVIRENAVRHERASYIPELSAEGDVVGFFSLVDDITELKHIQLTLAESEQRIRMLTDNLPALISYIDHEQRYRFCNAYTGTVFGVDTNTMLGRTMREVRGERIYRQIEDKVVAALRGERLSFEGEAMVGERVYHYQSDYIPDRAADGTVRGFYAMTFDVTALKTAERQLRTVMESSPLGMYVTDAVGRCSYTNPAWQRIAGLTIAESLGDGWSAALHPEDRERVFADLSAAAEGAMHFRSEHRFLRPDGTVVWTRVNAADIRESGRVVGYVGMVEDISEQHALDAALAHNADELARSNSELEQFAYVASHDLQEPLRMVTSYTQLLRKRYGDRLDGDATEFMRFIVEGGQRMQALITDLLDLSRVNTTRKAFEPVAFEQVLADSLAILGSRIVESGAVITHDALPTVLGDGRQLGQVLLNLIGNAIKFSGKKTPHIHISAQIEDEHWHFSMADNGIGIDARFFERIFVIFQRLHTRAEYPGTGIGLAICKKIVERHGGRIWVESVPGRGTTFHFTLAAALQTIAETPGLKKK